MPRALYFLKRCFRNMGAAPVLSLVTLVTVTLAMLVFGVFLLVFTNIRDVAQGLGSQLEVSAFLSDDVDTVDVLALKVLLENRPEVAKVTYVSKTDALARFEADYPEEAGLIKTLDGNPLPASLRVEIRSESRSIEHTLGVVEFLQAEEGVFEVVYGQEWLDRLDLFTRWMRAVTGALGLLLVMAIIVIVSNTIKLSLYARRDELEIMTLVGATDMFVRTPYLIEGTLQGLLGATLSAGLLRVIYLVAGSKSPDGFLPSLGLTHLAFLPWAWLLTLTLMGAVMGFAASAISTRRFLRT